MYLKIKFMFKLLRGKKQSDTYKSIWPCGHLVISGSSFQFSVFLPTRLSPKPTAFFRCFGMSWQWVAMLAVSSMVWLVLLRFLSFFVLGLFPGVKPIVQWQVEHTIRMVDLVRIWSSIILLSGSWWDVNMQKFKLEADHNFETPWWIL